MVVLFITGKNLTMLLDFAEIQAQLDKQFSEIPIDVQAELSDLRLRQSTSSFNQWNKLENQMNLSFPDSFKQVVLKYDFGNLTLGGVWFGQGESYEAFLLQNNLDKPENPWWGSGERPSHYLWIAASEGYIILLDLETEQILAYARSQHWKTSQVVAKNFDVFVRAVGTIFLSRDVQDQQKIACEICTAVGCSTNSQFWSDLINRFA